MKNMLRIKFLLLTVICSLIAGLQAYGQMKIGNNPTTVERASILELESNQQGLLLTRIKDTSDMTILNPPNGMIIYSVQDTALFIRANYVWKKLVDSAAVGGSFWNLKGNVGDSSNNFLGTTDATGMRIGTNNNPAIIISRNGHVQVVDSLQVDGNAVFGKSITIADSLRAGGAALNVTLDSISIGKTLVINDSVRLNMISNALEGDDSVLVLGADHFIRKTSLDSLGIRKIAGLGGPNIYLGIGRDSADFAIDSTSTAHSIIFNVPYASGTLGGAKNGLVDSVAQSFAGTKSFRDQVAIGTVDQAASTLDVKGNVGMAIATSASAGGYDLSLAANDTIRTLIVDVSGITGNIATPTVIPIKLPAPVQGRIYTIKKVGKLDDAQLDVIVSINPTSGTIEGGTKVDISNNWTAITLQAFNASSWSIVGH